VYILSQVLVILSDVLFIISMLKGNKKNVVFYLIFSTLLFGLHYMCLGGWTGALIAMLELIFLILMYVIEVKNKTQYGIYLSVITIILTVVVSILTWDTWISVLPMLAMVIYLITMKFNYLVIVKSGTFIRLVLNGIYMLLLKSYFGAGLTLVILAFTIVGIVNDYKARKENLKIEE